jgi:glycerol uptake facilitator-like aquaporin
MFSDTFAGIAPASVPAFVLAQIVDGALGAGLVLVLYPDVGDGAGDALVPRLTDHTTDSHPSAERSPR